MPRNELRAGYAHPVTRGWHDPTTPETARIVYPVFVTDDDNAREPIAAMPGQFRWGVNRLGELLDPLVEAGLRSVILFGVPKHGKDPQGSGADSPDSPVMRALTWLKKHQPDLLRITDVCLCAYTSHGHCGILGEHGHVQNSATVSRLADISLHYARAGAQVIGPSDMMDGRVGAIVRGLRAAGIGDVAMMSYAAKFASAFYGPFRDAAQSKPASGDRRSYQLPPAAAGLAREAMLRDHAEGADFIMVKPAGAYLDILREARDLVPVPLAAYQVSGEYAMLHHAAAAGAFALKDAVLESWTAMRRAGAAIVLTYFVKELLEWLPRR